MLSIKSLFKRFLQAPYGLLKDGNAMVVIFLSVLLVLLDGIEANNLRVQQVDLAPLYAFIGALVLGSFVYCCRQCCGQFELEQPLFRGLDLDDIILEENYDDKQGLLESKERAHKLLTRPTILSAAKTTNKTRKDAPGRHYDSEYYLDYDGYAEEKASSSVHSSPLKSKRSPVPPLNLSKTSPAAAKSPLPLVIAPDDQEEEKTDMWKLWNKNYEHKNSGFALDEEKKDEKEEKDDGIYKYQSIKFKKRPEILPGIRQQQQRPPQQQQQLQSLAVKKIALDVTPTPPRGAVVLSPPRPSMPRLDLAPLVRVPVAPPHIQAPPALESVVGGVVKPQAPAMVDDYSIKVSVQDYKYSLPSFANNYSGSNKNQMIPMIASTMPRPLPVGINSMNRPAPPIGRAPQSGRQPVGQQQEHQIRPPPPRCPPPGYLLRNRSLNLSGRQQPPPPRPRLPAGSGESEKNS